MDCEMSEYRSRASKKMIVMFTCIGRRVSLLQSFRKSIKQQGLKPCIIGTDVTELSPALQLCDKAILVKPVDHRWYLRELLTAVKKHGVDLLVPTVDLDLKLLAENRDKFEKLGCCVLISSPEVIDICQDKRKTFRFLSKAGFDTPRTMSSRSALGKEGRKYPYPCFLKPWDGYASRGNIRADNRLELEAFSRKIPNCIVQEYIDGAEYTCDVFVDFDGEVRCVVPRKRIEVRSGEVSKGQVVKDERIMSAAAEAVGALGAGPGVITLQLMAGKKGRIAIIEINPRFGGGIPLAIKAGANFPKWIVQLLIGKKPRIKFNGFKDKLVMLRYDSEVWLEK